MKIQQGAVHFMGVEFDLRFGTINSEEIKNKLLQPKGKLNIQLLNMEGRQLVFQIKSEPREAYWKEDALLYLSSKSGQLLMHQHDQQLRKDVFEWLKQEFVEMGRRVEFKEL